MATNLQNRARGHDPEGPRLLGERLCLDYVNTVESPHGAHPEDFLTSYVDLVRWARHVGLLDEDEAARLAVEGARRPGVAGVVFARALELRAALERIFRAIAHDAPPPDADLDRVRAAYLGALGRARLAPGGRGFDWAWPGGELALDRPLWAVARSAVETLTGDDPARIKECPGAGDCGWLFYDTSKNGSRRWCSMEGCGSRVKMRRQYRRQRARGEASAS